MIDTTSRIVRRGLPTQVLHYENVRSLVGVVALCTVAELLRRFVLNDGTTWIAWALVAVGVVGGLVDIAVFNRRLVRYTVIEGSATRTVLRTGRWVVTDICVRTESVLTVDVKEGPLLRRLGLARIRLNGLGRFPEFPPLAADDARALQHMLTRPAADHE